jgi:hypothetical protein
MAAAWQWNYREPNFDGTWPDWDEADWEDVAEGDPSEIGTNGNRPEFGGSVQVIFRRKPAALEDLPLKNCNRILAHDTHAWGPQSQFRCVGNTTPW